MLVDYYGILGVPVSADLATIKKAYRAKANVSHPDHGGSHEAMLQINEAYEILSNPEVRRRFDEARLNQANEAAQQATRTDSFHAQQRAEEYPRQWTDFDAWLEKEFVNVKYDTGQIPWASSTSGNLLIVFGLISGVVACIALTEAGKIPEDFPLRIYIPIVIAGGALGQWVHVQIGKSLKKEKQVDVRSPSSSSATQEMTIIHCGNCNQQLRVPASTDTTVRCPNCKHTFRVC